MKNSLTDEVRALRAELHALAERSGEETKTKAKLYAFLREKTTLRLCDEGAWLYALHEEPGAAETVAFRADMDALPYRNGAKHLCGHDGHSAILAGLGLWLEGRTTGRNILLIFQHAEETGEGGAVCAPILRRRRADRVYALHNIPGWPEGTVLLRRGVFACASKGMTLSFAGLPSHAAYPENGRNPGYAAARLIARLPELADQARYRGLTMATLIGADIGSRSFGTAAGRADVYLTLRAWHDEDLASLTGAVEDAGRTEAAKDGVSVSVSFRDVFPATENSAEAEERLEKSCETAELEHLLIPEPMRWSEDFGHYGRYAEAAMAGVGAGESWPQLHTETYEFNDRVIAPALALLEELAVNG